MGMLLVMISVQMLLDGVHHYLAVTGSQRPSQNKASFLPSFRGSGGPEGPVRSEGRARAYMEALRAGTAEAMARFLTLYPSSPLPGSEMGASIEESDVRGDAGEPMAEPPVVDLPVVSEPKYQMASTSSCSASVLVSSARWPVTMLMAPAGTSDVSKI